jgi:surface polysaccharide O-acyltransferase-like enzyme
MSMNVAQRRYTVRFLSMMSLYVVSIVGVSWTFGTSPPAGETKYLLAALPALPIIGILVVLGRYLVEERDEFMRHRHMVAMLLATGIVLSFCATWGLLEFFAQVPPIGLFHVSWGFFATWGFCSAVVGFFYR